MTQTTGTIIAACTDMGTRIMIAEDLGSYDGTKPELNVRKLRTIEILDLSISSDAFQAVSGRGEAYGCGWGDTGKLHPVTQTDIAALRAAAAEKKAKKDAWEQKRREEEEAWVRNVAPHVCPKCRTFCMGDCTAGR